MDAITFKLMLLDNTATFVAANTLLNDVAGVGHTKEVSGNGWTLGGETLAGVSGSIINVNETKLDATDISKTATGGSIGPAFSAVLFNADGGDDPPFIYFDFETSKEAITGRDFIFRWASDGLFNGLLP